MFACVILGEKWLAILIPYPFESEVEHHDYSIIRGATA
jgi:hypothetical protein